jgi:hypothetical protein
MARYQTVQTIEPASGRGDDRIAVVSHDQRTIIVVADGAGGIGSGSDAAETVVREVAASQYLDFTTPAHWELFLRQLDFRIGAGESTAVIVDLRPDSVIGASVGDSCAWIVRDGELIDLTANQVRKPLLGSGNAVPVGFNSGALVGTLLVASDGFGNYVKRNQLAVLIARTEFIEIPRRCVERVRLRSGELWDDVAIVACRVSPPSRKSYSI